MRPKTFACSGPYKIYIINRKLLSLSRSIAIGLFGPVQKKFSVYLDSPYTVYGIVYTAVVHLKLELTKHILF